MNLELLAKKKQFIPMFARGEISERKCAALIGIRPVSVWRLKKRWLASGDAVWIHGNTGRRPHNRRYDYAKLAADYGKFAGTPFASFRDAAADYLHYKHVPSYTTVYKALRSAGIISPRARIPVREKKKHLPRKERPNEGDLVQIDGSSHEWFLGLKKTCLHGGIDDATHKVTALYMCANECRLGYYAVLRRTYARFGGFPRALYSDKKFTLCLSEEYGIRALLDGKYYDVELAEPLVDVAGDKMPYVEKELLYRYFYADTHSGRAVIRAG